MAVRVPESFLGRNCSYGARPWCERDSPAIRLWRVLRVGDLQDTDHVTCPAPKVKQEQRQEKS